ncbi:MAG: hypothetical protein ACOYI5_03870 [Christensenellales bacterium]|jgi:hypothetical protein
MNRSEDAPVRKRGISLINWMGTLILTAIPGVNILALILMMVFAKSRAKRTFAGAALILMAIGVILTFAAFLIFGAQLVEFARTLVDAPVITP